MVEWFVVAVILVVLFVVVIINLYLFLTVIAMKAHHDQVLEQVLIDIYKGKEEEEKEGG